MSIADSTFSVTEVTRPTAFEFAANLPIINNGNKSINKDLVAGNGSTINVSLPGYGKTTTGPAIADADLGNSDAEIPVTVIQYKNAIATDMIANALEIEDYENQVAKPRGAQLASSVQTVAAESLLLSASSATIVNSGTLSFSDLAIGSALIRRHRGVGELVGCLNPSLTQKVIASGVNQFNYNQSGKDEWMYGSLGMNANAKWFETADIPDFVSGTLAAAGGGAITLKGAVSANGSTSLVFDNGGTGTLTGTLKKGDRLQTGTAKTVDIYGNATVTPFQFIVQEDATASGNEITVTVQAIYFTAGDPRKNISLTSLADNLVFTRSHTAGKTYCRGMIWQPSAFLTASCKPKKLRAIESAMVQAPNGLIVLGQSGGLIQQGLDITRWDVMAGFKVIRDNLVSIYEQIMD